ncbi:hypothetical protein TrVE_jg2094 [Triparma verrucosa]|uniref:SET domain-containing protein n=1 Tax=Triparma verrucosa TaxID=1606542 RepID=A0A9W7CPT9_9STRA|nr:hypothetical protein TrVE_jg2094 [Triparma verrucosa]
MIESSQKDGGKGLRSTTFIKSGSLIFRDIATLRCPNSFPAESESEAQALQNSCVETRFSHLSLSSRTSLMTLASHVSPSSPTIAGIFQTNAVRLQGKDSADGAIFETFCRMNHSCNPNVSHQWKDDLQRLELTALRDIPPSTEMYVSYNNNNSNASSSDVISTKERRKHLRDNFGFICMCELCVIDNEM